MIKAEFDRVRGLPDLAGKIRKFGDRYYGIGPRAQQKRAPVGTRRMMARRGRCTA